MRTFVEEHREAFGVEPVCQLLQIASSGFYAAKARPPSARSRRDAWLEGEIVRVHAENFGVYGARKVWHQLNREQIPVARCTLERLMRAKDLHGARRGKAHRTTRPDLGVPRPPDLVERSFTASRPNQLWVADFTYVRTCTDHESPRTRAGRTPRWRPGRALE